MYGQRFRASDAFYFAGVARRSRVVMRHDVAGAYLNVVIEIAPEMRAAIS